jgi:4-hydroxyphenylpyruvate dioxygenase
MGPFPHDTLTVEISTQNPMGTNGFEFVEFASPNPQELHELFQIMGFSPVAKHKHKNATLYQQGNINYVLNAEQSGHAYDFCLKHGACAPSMAFRVVDAAFALKRAVLLGAKEITTGKTMNVPAIEGIGGSLLYFIERENCYEEEFSPLPATLQNDVGLFYLDHLTHNVQRGNMDKWCDFYIKLFNFKQIRFFDIEGKITGLFSKALTSPCGKIRIPINESADDKSQIEEYLHHYKGEGIQHIACGSKNIYETIESLRARDLNFMPPPPHTYFERIDQRLPKHGEDVKRLQKNGILIDGEGVVEGGLTKILLQIFSSNAIGPIFFEFIERKGDDGFGEGNFRALFESIEEDQMRRGVI